MTPLTSFRDLTLSGEYRTGDGPDPATSFFGPCLAVATRYDRAVGYFRSTALAVVQPEIVAFAARRGRIRMIASPLLAEEDIAAIARGYKERLQIVALAAERDIDEMLSHPAMRGACEVLATLIAAGSMDLQVAFRATGHGIYHEKLGLLTDQFDNTVAFRGSANETGAAWGPEGNLESIDVFRSWGAADESARASRHADYFERLWRNGVQGVEVVPFPEVARERLLSVARASINELSASRVSEAVTRYRTLFPHQEVGLAAWRAAGKRGILEHATGSGKTVTALAAIREHVATGSPAMVVVPTQLLHAQWYEEIKKELPDATVMLAGAGHEGWKEPSRLRHFLSPTLQRPRILLATNATASSVVFRRQLSEAKSMLLVSDEVHTLGSPGNRELFAVPFAHRLGLSATPQRFGDQEGTHAILEYFGGVIKPPFTLADAVAAGRLCQYEYTPHFASLSTEEQAEWNELSLRISKAAAILSSRGAADREEGSQRLVLLLIERQRIVKKASAKLAIAADVLVRAVTPGSRWLVYCEDRDQLGQLHDLLRGQGLLAREYHSAMAGDKLATLAWLRVVGGVVLSIRCLDEGVDIPSVDHALIVASSQNPRQFIQRRGRVLRVAQGKGLAYIHDILVLPGEAREDSAVPSYARSELARAMEFAETAINGSARVALLERAAASGVDLAAAANYMEESDEPAAV